MIARYLTEMVLTMKNSDALKRHIKEYEVPHHPSEHYVLSDEKPGTWFLKGFNKHQDAYVLVYAFSSKTSVGVEDYIRATRVFKQEKPSEVIHCYHYGPFINFSDADKEEKARMNSDCVRKLMTDLANTSTIRELEKKMSNYYRDSHSYEEFGRKEWR